MPLVLPVIVLTRRTVPRLEVHLDLLASAGVAGVALSGVVAGDRGDQEGGALDLGGYQEASARIEHEVRLRGLACVRRSPLWLGAGQEARERRPLPVCTASDNAPAVMADGTIRPCHYSEIVMGTVAGLSGPGVLCAPIRILTDLAPESVDPATLCLACLSRHGSAGDRRGRSRADAI
jgi:hypothetical protein